MIFCFGVSLIVIIYKSISCICVKCFCCIMTTNLGLSLIVVVAVGVNYNDIAYLGATIGGVTLVGAIVFIDACWHSVAVVVGKVPVVREIRGGSTPHKIANVVNHLDCNIGCWGTCSFEIECCLGHCWFLVDGQIKV